MNFIEQITKRYQEGKESKAKTKKIYEDTFKEEEKVFAEERAKIRAKAKTEREATTIARAKAKAIRDVRNPFFQRAAKKAGALGQEAINIVAKDIGKQVARVRAEKEVLDKVRSKAKMRELARIAASQGKAKARGVTSPKKGMSRRLDPAAGMGNNFFDDTNSFEILDSGPKNKGSKQPSKNNLLGDGFGSGNYFGTTTKKNKSSKQEGFKLL